MGENREENNCNNTNDYTELEDTIITANDNDNNNEKSEYIIITTPNKENTSDTASEIILSGNNETIEKKQILTKKLLFLLSFAAFAVVGNLYYCQPLLVEMRKEFNKTPSEIGLVTTSTQIGYSIGLIAITPLGDILPRRKIILTLGVLVCFSLIVVGFSVSYEMLCVTSLVMGLLTVMPQIIVPLCADLSDSKSQGKIVGTVMAGIVLGILLSRTISGWVGEGLGWRAIYWGACIVIGLTTTLLYFMVPKVPVTSQMTYLQLAGSLVDLLRTQPLLWQSGIMGATVFGSFSCFWTTVTFRFSEAPYNYESGVIGLFSLVGAAGVIGAPLGGFLVDKKGDRFTMGLALFTVLGNMLILAFLDDYLAALIFGMFFFDMAVQTCQVCNQTRIYKLVPEKKGRVNSIYMVMMYSGGAAGSALGSFAYGQWGWRGSGSTALIMICIAVITFFSFPDKYCGGARKNNKEKDTVNIMEKDGAEREMMENIEI